MSGDDDFFSVARTMPLVAAITVRSWFANHSAMRTLDS
jgi:hypothetical protein